MRVVTLFLSCFILFISSSLHAEVTHPHQLTIAERRADLEQLIHQIKNQYGPKEFKRQYFGIDVDQLASRYWRHMAVAPTNGEYYSLMIKFIAEFRDGHFSANIPTDYRAYLPIDVNLVQGKVLIEYVFRNQLPEEDFPFDRGDEVVSMDGRPVGALIDEFSTSVSSGNPRATRGKAAYFLTHRPGWRVPVPSGIADVGIRRLGEDETHSVRLEWRHYGERFDEYVLSKAVRLSPSRDDIRFDPTSLSSREDIAEYHPNMEFSYHCNGTTRIAIPEDAMILMEEPFTVYYHPTPKGNVGYLRIPHYYPPDEDNDGRADFEQWYEYYRWALTELEANTVGLIIDQDHNCGGNVFYLEDLVSLFMAEPFEPLVFQFRASKRELLGLKNWMAAYERPYYRDYDGLLEVYALLEEAFEEGRYLTRKTTIHGSQLIASEAVYTKPVVMLIDYFAGSGGDAFPGLMQGNGRAKLLGTATAGLGGHVNDMEPLFYSQIQTRMTQSLFFHPDGHYIENRGAIPDIPYEITVDDFLNGYQDYQQFYLRELLKLID